MYEITVQDTRSGIHTTTYAQILVSAHGILHIPKMPLIPGLDTFKGQLFHSSKWDTSLDLSGKRVAVIGNGSSAYFFLLTVYNVSFNTLSSSVSRSFRES